ncbi:hypothetical protein BpHYR1_039306 [Brachionus plicatilis]|uniref:Uncharacterized protein n=1 Tax=Brachionus plicatilis TaxID=10195 RepID=A0A3M7Q2S7_BRAPC|nr:hypothetical protein BpHYR1_039306 [Brachionus plicatilis]
MAIEPSPLAVTKRCGSESNKEEPNLYESTMENLLSINQSDAAPDRPNLSQVTQAIRVLLLGAYCTP